MKNVIQLPKVHALQSLPPLRDGIASPEENKKRREETGDCAVKEKRLYFNCFATKHMARSCWKASACDVHGCLSKHSKLLHYPLQSPGGRPRLRQDHGVEQQGRAEDKDQPVKGHICACGPSQPETSKIALPIVSVKVRAKGQRKYVHTYALLDSGSTKTFCSRTLVDKLGLEGTKTTLSLTTVKDNERSDTVVVALEITGARRSYLQC